MHIGPAFRTSSLSLPLAPDIHFTANSGQPYFLPDFHIREYKLALHSALLTVFHHGDVHEARVGSVEYAAVRVSAKLGPDD